MLIKSTDAFPPHLLCKIQLQGQKTENGHTHSDKYLPIILNKSKKKAAGKLFKFFKATVNIRHDLLHC